MNEMIIRINETDIRNIVTESIKRILNEKASKFLYHFLSFDRFVKLIKTNSFTTSPAESSWRDDRKNAISFTRTKSFREGWPVLFYGGDDGRGDDWCGIRLTVDGNLINTKPNFKIDGKQYNMSVEPFDWAYHEYDEGDPYSFADNNNGIFAQNGKEWMMQSDDYTTSYLPIHKKNKKYVDGICDKQGHPYSQAEDRLVTYADTIPNALSYIIRTDILIVPNYFSEDNLDDRQEMFNMLKNSEIRNKIHIYKSLRDLEMNTNEITDLNILLREKSEEEIPRSKEWTIKRDF